MARPLESSTTDHVCRLNGVSYKLATDKLVTLRDLERSLEGAIRDAHSAADSEYFWRAIETSTKLVSVVCDLIVAFVGEKAGIPGKAISTGYDVAKLIVDGFNGELTAKKGFLYAGGVKVDALAAVLQERKLHKYAELLGAVKTLAATGIDLYDYWEDRGHDNFTSGSGVVSARHTAYRILLQLRAQIAAVESTLADCDGSFLQTSG